MTIILVLLLGLLGCRAGLPEVEISTGRRLYKGYQVWTSRGVQGKLNWGTKGDRKLLGGNLGESAIL